MDNYQREELKDDTILYRIMPLEHFITWLVENKNTLVRHTSWEDPYEKKVMESKIIFSPNEEEKKVSSLDWERWYGQSWSIVAESDGLWRAFTHNKEVRSVKIKTTKQKLLESIKLSDTQKERPAKVYLDSVTYIKEGQYESAIMDLIGYYGKQVSEQYDFRNIQNNDFLFKAILAYTLLQMKRTAFTYEQEVRLLAYDELGNEDINTYAYKFNPQVLIDEIEFDPWTNDFMYDTYIQFLKSFGFENKSDKEVVKFSKMYNKTQKGYHFAIYNTTIETNNN